MRNKVVRTTAELEQELRDQLHLLKLDAANYDAGIELAAKSMATKLRVLLHDTAHSHSLLGQTGKKDTLFTDTALNQDPENVFSHSGLIAASMGPKGAKYVPHLDDTPGISGQQIAFDKWWNATVFLDKEKQAFSRKDLVLALANQDGGAHVDPELDEKYFKLTRQNSLGWLSSTSGGEWKALSNPHYAAIRQIAHEVLKTLVPGYQAPPVGTEPSIKIAGMRIGISPTPALPVKPAKKIGRNDPCHCGSGKKYKKCCGD